MLNVSAKICNIVSAFSVGKYTLIDERHVQNYGFIFHGNLKLAKKRSPKINISFII